MQGNALQLFLVIAVCLMHCLPLPLPVELCAYLSSVPDSSGPFLGSEVLEIQ